MTKFDVLVNEIEQKTSFKQYNWFNLWQFWIISKNLRGLDYKKQSNNQIFQILKIKGPNYWLKKLKGWKSNIYQIVKTKNTIKSLIKF